jgi:hypothetical protein
VRKKLVVAYFKVLYQHSVDHSGRAVYGRSLAVIVGSNPVKGMDVCLL